MGHFTLNLQMIFNSEKTSGSKWIIDCLFSVLTGGLYSIRASRTWGTTWAGDRRTATSTTCTTRSSGHSYREGTSPPPRPRRGSREHCQGRRMRFSSRSLGLIITTSQLNSKRGQQSSRRKLKSPVRTLAPRWGRRLLSWIVILLERSSGRNIRICWSHLAK